MRFDLEVIAYVRNLGENFKLNPMIISGGFD